MKRTTVQRSKWRAKGGGGSRLFFKFSTTRRRDRRRRDVLSARRIRGARFTIAFLRPRSYLLRSSLPFKTRIRSPVTRNRDGISFDDSHAPGLFSFPSFPLLSFRISSAAFLLFSRDLLASSASVTIRSKFRQFRFVAFSLSESNNPREIRVEFWNALIGVSNGFRDEVDSRERRRASGVEKRGKNARRRG